MKGPLFSVVVVAHDRREYLMSALRSISNQTIPRHLFEAVIVKNFDDDEADKYAEAEGFTLVLTDEIPVGGKMVIGIRNTHGKYIVFLEDDDQFDETKLERLYQYVNRKENIEFVHNSFVTIDAQGKELATNTKDKNVNFDKGNSFFKMCNQAGIGAADLVLASCMLISRSIISKHLNEFSKIVAAPDIFVLISFLNSQNSGIHTKEKLTKYRMHQSQSNKTGNRTDLIKQNLEIRKCWKSDYSIMIEAFKRDEAHELAKYFYNYNSLFVLLLQDQRNVLSKTLGSFQLIKSLRTMYFGPSLMLILLTLLSALSPTLSQMSYYRYRRRKYVSTFY